MRSQRLVNPINASSADNQLKIISEDGEFIPDTDKQLAEILFVTTYPPRECGIATYSYDLIKALENKFKQSFIIRICALESESEQHTYTDEIKYILNTDRPNAFIKLAKTINENAAIKIVLIQHEFGFFEKKEEKFNYFLKALAKPVIVVFHTVLPHPNELLKVKVKAITTVAESVIVMTRTSAKILNEDYGVPSGKVVVIPHGTHLVAHANKDLLKKKYQLCGKKVMSTFGLLSSGKSIETTLEALSAIVEKHPDVLFLIIGITHPSVVKQEGEKYRRKLEGMVATSHLQQYVKFINSYLPLTELLEYLQLTDIYLFTSADRNQAVSGTFAYAISCGCPIISTPIPHAREVLKNDAGVIIDFENSKQLSEAAINLLNDEQVRKNMSSKGLQRMASTAWENSAIAHAMLFENIDDGQISLCYTIPPINLNHFKKLTTDFGMIQFSAINQPNINSGYTLDDNARAMVAICQHFELTKDKEDIRYIKIYLKFIKYCLQPEGDFLNYVNEKHLFTEHNKSTDLADANGRAIWASGYLISIGNLLANELTIEANSIMDKALLHGEKIYSTRAMAFIIKGLYYRTIRNRSVDDIRLIKELANRLVKMYRSESDKQWRWYENFLTYANSIIPEAMLCAWLATGEQLYKDIAQSSFDFLLSKIIKNNRIKVISNKGWLHKGEDLNRDIKGGEQPIDVAYTILALSKFYDVFRTEEYKHIMKISFDWFLGANDLHQIIYNPCTGGCYDGLEEFNVNLNQGAESTVSYLMARLTIEKYNNEK